MLSSWQNIHYKEDDLPLLMKAFIAPLRLNILFPDYRPDLTYDFVACQSQIMWHVHNT
jgi:hypothetical protein